MADVDIGGTVIQRSFVPRGLGVVINIASVPLHEIAQSGSDVERDDFLRQITGELLGIPSASIIDESQYEGLGRLLVSSETRKRFRRSVRDPWTYEWYNYNYGYLRERLMPRMERADSPRLLFAQDFLSLLARPDAVSLGASPLTLGPWSYSARARDEDLQEWGQFRELHLTTEGFQAGLACIYSGLSAEERVRTFTSTLQRYEIPLGQSPQVTGTSLLGMIEGGKKLCLAPLVASGALGIGQLQQGAYVGSLQTVVTGAAMTLILIGTVSVGDILVRYMMQRRPSIESEGSPSKQKRKKNYKKDRGTRRGKKDK